MDKSTLRLDWCSPEAACFAVKNWHYSKCMPMPLYVRVGAWERGKFIGCVLFSKGACPRLGEPYDLLQPEVAELVRVALTKHETPVSRIVAIAVRFLAKHSPGLRLLVSFADTAQNHHGGIYQAGGWIYAGSTIPGREYLYEGRWCHARFITGHTYGTPRPVADISKLPMRRASKKHRYLFPLDAAMRAQLAPLAQPYPKRPGGGNDAGGSKEGTSDVPADPPTLASVASRDAPRSPGEKAVRLRPGRSKAAR